jgi:hypothetical protein
MVDKPVELFGFADDAGHKDLLARTACGEWQLTRLSLCHKGRLRPLLTARTQAVFVLQEQTEGDERVIQSRESATMRSPVMIALHQEMNISHAAPGFCAGCAG